jgi:RimJ/RimL family protein N-acetyltransferase
MTEAATFLLEYAFSSIHFHRIRCAAATDNTSSQKVIERLGFQKEGLAREAERVAGRWVTHVVYSRLASDPVPALVMKPR